MANHDPLVSIGMPVRNNERTLDLALRSILNQTYRHWELLTRWDGHVTTHAGSHNDEPYCRA